MNAPVLFTAKALFDHQSTKSGHAGGLSFQQGDTIDILEVSNATSLYKGRCGDKIGWFPQKLVHTDQSPRSNPSSPSTVTRALGRVRGITLSSKKEDGTVSGRSVSVSLSPLSPQALSSNLPSRVKSSRNIGSVGLTDSSQNSEKSKTRNNTLFGSMRRQKVPDIPENSKSPKSTLESLGKNSKLRRSNTDFHGKVIEHEGQVFGMPLKAIPFLPYQLDPELDVVFSLPRFLIKTTNWLKENNCFVQEGVFRVSGRAWEIEELKQSFEKDGVNAQIPVQVDHNSVTSLMKLFLRQLPQPLMNNYSEWVKAEKSDQETREKLFENLLKDIPQKNLEVLKFLVFLCAKISEYKDQNMMNVTNLGRVFGPSILYNPDPLAPPDMDALHIPGDIFSHLIENRWNFFPQPPSPPSPVEEEEKQSIKTRNLQTLKSSKDPTQVPPIPLQTSSVTHQPTLPSSDIDIKSNPSTTIKGLKARQSASADSLSSFVARSQNTSETNSSSNTTPALDSSFEAINDNTEDLHTITNVNESTEILPDIQTESKPNDVQTVQNDISPKQIQDPSNSKPLSSEEVTRPSLSLPTNSTPIQTSTETPILTTPKSKQIQVQISGALVELSKRVIQGTEEIENLLGNIMEKVNSSTDVQKLDSSFSLISNCIQSVKNLHHDLKVEISKFNNYLNSDPTTSIAVANEVVLSVENDKVGIILQSRRDHAKIMNEFYKLLGFTKFLLSSENDQPSKDLLLQIAKSVRSLKQNLLKCS